MTRIGRINADFLIKIDQMNLMKIRVDPPNPCHPRPPLNYFFPLRLMGLPYLRIFSAA